MKRLAILLLAAPARFLGGVMGGASKNGLGSARVLMTWLAAFAMIAATFVAITASAPGTADAHSQASCGPNDREEPALQGQVPVSERLNGNAEPGYWCNLELVGRFPSFGQASFDTYENCAYYPDNVSLGIGAGVVVLDVSEPTHPVKTDYLTARAMRSPGESLRVNKVRGLLAADYYTWPAYSADGVPESPEIYRSLAVYDISQDCTHPTLLADVIMPNGLGHEGCFQPDGMVYYMSGGSITPIDLTDPADPRELTEPWQPSEPLPVLFHGCSISDDGTRGYFTDALNNQMLIVDTSVQGRILGAQMRVLGRFQTPHELEQSTVPLTYSGRPHVLLFTEAKYPSKVCVTNQPNFGYPRIIDVADVTNPVEVSKIQTEVVYPQNCSQVAADWAPQTRGLERGDAFNPGVSVVFFGGYDSHYCTTDRLQDPTLLACAQLGSGLRVYDIRDPAAPTEIAYFNTGTARSGDPTLDWAFARPVIQPDLRQIWWTTFAEGFHAAEFRDGVWPLADMDHCPAGDDYDQDQYDLEHRACQARGGQP